jgi:hypothetical protein
MVFKLLRPDSISVWNNEEIIKRYSNYKGIIEGTNLARYLIAKTLECKFNNDDSIENLEKLLEVKSKEFNELLKKDIEELKNRKNAAISYIDLAEKIANKSVQFFFKDAILDVFFVKIMIFLKLGKVREI